MSASELKKISIVETNNAPYFIYTGEWVYERNDLAYLKKLKAYAVKMGFKAKEKSELEFVTAALKWVSAQWDHDGINKPPAKFKALDILKAVKEKKEQYRCVEYGIVLTELLQAYGFDTRTVSLRSKDVAYGGFGQGHVAMEVWINELSKWIFLDPQFGAYVTEDDNEKPLNYHEMFQQKLHKNKWADLKVVFVSEDKDDDEKRAKEYKKFISQYFGHMKVAAGKDKPNIGLLLEATEMPLTFQGYGVDNIIYTKDANLIYPSMNRVTILLDYKEKEDPIKSKKKLDELEIMTDQEYLDNMYKFAVKPNFTVTAKTAATNVREYEYRVDSKGKWKTFKKFFKWSIKSTGKLEVRSINDLGRKGPITFVELQYK